MRRVRILLVAGLIAASIGSEAEAQGILSAADKASFQRLSRSLGGANGVTVSGIGSGQKIESAGSLKTGTAWSTIKVPIAMAVIDAGGENRHADDLTKAITASDNAAAERLWASLGGPETAAQATTAQLRNAGDIRTDVNAQKLLAAYTPFGQTAWALSMQARFAAQLPCSAAGVRVLDLMGQVVDGQRWGLGTAQEAQFKGGWGPGSTPGRESGYLDRQFGIITVRGTPLAVAIASRPADGSHSTGTRHLSAITRWLMRNASVKGLPAQPAC
ncbi:hypothetical protein OJ998_27055 [Solirubrobacter taibaiensis]|nr:hypothetical protein [Solirubrobacter taibaiensis]